MLARTVLVVGIPALVAALAGCVPALPGTTTCMFCSTSTGSVVVEGGARPSPAAAGPGAATATGPAEGAPKPPPEPAADAPAPTPGPVPDLAAIAEAEGFSPERYVGPGSAPHIGHGHRVTPAEAGALLEADMAAALAAAERVVGNSYWASLSEGRREVLAELAFILGETGLRGFEQLLAAVRRADFVQAAAEIVASRMAEQIPARATGLARRMRDG